MLDAEVINARRKRVVVYAVRVVAGRDGDARNAAQVVRRPSERQCGKRRDRCDCPPRCLQVHSHVLLVQMKDFGRLYHSRPFPASSPASGIPNLGEEHDCRIRHAGERISRRGRRERSWAKQSSSSRYRIENSQVWIKRLEVNLIAGYETSP